MKIISDWEGVKISIEELGYSILSVRGTIWNKDKSRALSLVILNGCNDRVFFSQRDGMFNEFYRFEIPYKQLNKSDWTEIREHYAYAVENFFEIHFDEWYKEWPFRLKI